MIGFPDLLPETPPSSADPLSDLLGAMRLTGVVLFRAEFREPWSVVAADAEALARLIPFRAERIIPFHLVARGGCWLGMPGADPVWLEAGDAVVLPHGDRHSLAMGEATSPVEVGRLLPSPPWSEPPLVTHGGGGRVTELICGFLQCDELPFHPLLRGLPGLLHVRPGLGGSDAWLASTIRHTAAEVRRGGPGARSMAPRLTELMFVEILRAHLHGLSADDAGWFAAFRDPVAGAALRLLHADPLRDWSVDGLARRVGASRTVLAGRFKHFLGEPPMRYLARWRLLMAAQQIKTSERPLKAIADQAGYESEAAFSRAFKRHFGAAPSQWRRRAQAGSSPG